MAIEINPVLAHRASVIWLHGLGADGNDFVDIIPELKLSPELGVKFIFPHAPFRPITLNGGYEMRAWFDIETLDIDGFIDESGIAKSLTSLQQLIAKEMASGIASKQIVLAGFSQGAALILRHLLSATVEYAGFLAISGFLPLSKNYQHPALSLCNSLKNNEKFNNKDQRVLMLHGEHDDVVPLTWADFSVARLRQFGVNVDFRTYITQHSICYDEITDIGNWLNSVLST